VPRNRSNPRAAKDDCIFCALQNDAASCFRVWEDENVFVFLDHRPLFPGHCLLITKRHIRSLADLPASLLQPVFADVQMITSAVQRAMNAEGTFVAINNVVSQSVPHFHVHIVPRRKGDGLRGFFWPRKKYESNEHAAAVASAIREEIARVKSA
jgi:histidine triad (HIT) family protein